METTFENHIKQTFPVLGMSCAACAVSVESTLKSVNGVHDAGVNYATQTAWADYDDSVTTTELQNAVRAIGYDLVVDVEDPHQVQQDAQSKHYNELKKRTILASLLSLPIVIIGMFFMEGSARALPYGNWIMMALAAPVVFMLGRTFFVNAFKQARHGRANMDTLVALSTGIAFLFSAFNTIYPEFWHARGLHAHVYFEAAAVVIAFILLGKLMEEKAKSNTSSALKKLMGLQPKTVTVIRDGLESGIPVADVKVGDSIVIKPGEKIPVDGVTTEGSSFVDESMISGEPVAVEKKQGEQVFAGTINQKGSFVFVAEKVGGDTILAQIIKMVQQAQGSKAPVQKLVDKIAGIFVPVVIGIAILTFIGWMLLGGENAFTHALMTSVTVLVIACPCALGLATPTAIMVGVGKGAENNILIKDAESLELAHKVNAIILDKTGTITEGKPAVTQIVWEKEIQDQTFSEQVLLAMESRSEHPLAEAVVNRLKKENVQKASLQSFDSVTGQGVRAVCNGADYFVGNKTLISEGAVAISSELVALAEKWQQEAQTVIYFADNTNVLAIIAIADKIKTTSKQAVEKLQHMGIEVYMLTGDNRQTAAAVAGQVGLRHYKAEVMPSEKAAFVKQLQAEGKIVAMVGDGINDSHALAQADVSIAMGKGSDIAMDVAKMTLITSDLNMIPKALNLSAKTVKTIRQNLFWAFIYNLIGIPVAAGVLYAVNGFLLDPMLAGAAMALSSVSVVGNSLRLKAMKL
ncbi:heavy metal translocating P-type ATPase [Dyadobacter chenwenxiniae]|uniref:P-type Cu(+) transporter n=1 Tax=Dyadobacter chenwenxiniae TaxID=2906456 RepID=A0A9X1PL14_9BACT|nr:heavy metal translocating P-type ATPase [Dyadobacter chenwenxiniae]MCF0062843.1 heavy metal translocating P-type ATPase [Dyadobacter chenwenxiniae]UON84982.1 heavy metal translocating P-type ATPase [Dyadobacter chenwenxiniae]